MHRGMVNTFPVGGVNVPTVRFPPAMSIGGATYRRPPPRLGQDTLKYSAAVSVFHSRR